MYLKNLSIFIIFQRNFSHDITFIVIVPKQLPNINSDLLEEMHHALHSVILMALLVDIVVTHTEINVTKIFRLNPELNGPITQFHVEMGLECDGPQKGIIALIGEQHFISVVKILGYFH